MSRRKKDEVPIVGQLIAKWLLSAGQGLFYFYNTDNRTTKTTGQYA